MGVTCTYLSTYLLTYLRLSDNTYTHTHTYARTHVKGILIHLTNSLSSVRYAERLPCGAQLAVTARTQSRPIFFFFLRRTPGVLASWHPCGLIYGLQLTSLEPASSSECSTENHPTWYIATNIREQARLDGSYFANEAKDLYLSTLYSSRRIDANGQKRDWKGDVLVIETPLTLYFSEFDLIPL